MKTLRDITIKADDAEFVYHAVCKYRADLEQYRTWLKTVEGRALPGAEIALAEVSTEVSRYLAISMEIYRQCYSADGNSEGANHG